MPDSELTLTLQRAQNFSRSNWRGYLLMGEDDPYGQNKPAQVAHILEQHGMNCEIDIRSNLGHDYPPNFSQTLNAILEKF